MWQYVKIPTLHCCLCIVYTLLFVRSLTCLFPCYSHSCCWFTCTQARRICLCGCWYSFCMIHRFHFRNNIIAARNQIIFHLVSFLHFVKLSAVLHGLILNSTYNLNIHLNNVTICLLLKLFLPLELASTVSSMLRQELIQN